MVVRSVKPYIQIYRPHGLFLASGSAADIAKLAITADLTGDYTESE